METTQKRLDRLERILTGNGKQGLTGAVHALTERDKEVRQVIREWQDFKAEMRGVKKTAIVIGALVTLAGGTLGAAILRALGQIAAALP